MGRRKTVGNFLKFYFDPDLLTEKEAGEELIKAGINISKLKTNAKEFLKKEKAKLSIEKGKSNKEMFVNLLEEFYNKKDELDLSGGNYIPQFGYRKKYDDKTGNTNDDTKLLNFIEKKNRKK